MNTEQTLQKIRCTWLLVCLMPLIVMGADPSTGTGRGAPEAFAFRQFFKLKKAFFTDELRHFGGDAATARTVASKVSAMQVGSFTGSRSAFRSPDLTPSNPVNVEAKANNKPITDNRTEKSTFESNSNLLAPPPPSTFTYDNTSTKTFNNQLNRKQQFAVALNVLEKFHFQSANSSVQSTFLEEDLPFNMVDYQTIPVGSFIINMGVQPQTVNNALKPYGLIWDLLENHKVPIIWVINPDKGKDGNDFSYNGIDFKGGPFIISAEYRNSAVNQKIANWQALGVVGVTTTSEVTVPVNRVLSHSMRWTLDDQNGSIAQKFLQNAGIPSSGYNWVAPSALNCCNDLLVMPHAEPTWSTHSKLLSWNDSEANGGCGGAIWAGCRAVSELENIVNPNNAAQKLNFLMKDPVAPATTPAVPAGNHNDGNPPYSYTSNFGHPVMQFLGTLDGGQESGAEQVYLPTTGWRPSTIIGVWDPTQSNLGTLSPGPAAKLAFGHAFGNTSRGYVNYTGGHDIAKSNNEPNIAAQRTFFNFSFLALYDKSIKPMTVIPSTAYSGQSYLFSASATGGTGNYYYTWTSSCGGTFSDPNSASSSFTAPVVSVPTHCTIQLLITDDCGFRTSFKSIEISIEPSNIEICNNGIDDDGDGLVDSYDQDCCSSLVELSKTGWTLKYVDSQETIGENGAATNAFDGNMNTFWLSKWSNGNDPLPHEIQIDLGATINIGGLRFLPRQSGVNGRIKNYEIYLSQDGINWGLPIVSGIWTYDNSNAKEVQFSITSARFVRLRATSEAQGNPWTSLAEIDVLFCTSFENCTNGIDEDGDGFVDNFDTDCFNFGLCNNTPGQNDITGSVFFDPNGNLAFDNGEYTQPNVSISLYRDNNLDGSIGPGDDLAGSKETNAAGQYSFTVTPTYDFSNNYQIPSGCNDGRDGTNNETRLQFGKDRNIGLRFTGINIPSGATITNARLVFVANTNQNNTGSVDIYAHKTASPPDFCSNSNVNLRTRTTAKTAWTVGGWTNGSTYQSADIKNVLQEMTSTYGAYSNGTLALIMISTGSNNVEAKSFENNSALAPGLLIEYSIGGVQYLVRVEPSTLPPYMQLTSPNPKTVLLTALGTTSCNNNFAFKKAQESCSNGLDDDGDGFIDCADTDCNFNLAASAGPNVGICSGGNTTLTASATGGVTPYTFSWSSGLGTGASKTVNPSTSTTYTVTVTSANGCTATNQVMVSVVPTPGITAQPTDATICMGGTNVLSVTATGGTPFLTYQWQSSLTGSSPWVNIVGATSNSYATAPLMVTTYYRVVVSATGNGCTSATSVGAKITVVPSPTITSHPVSAAICSGGAQTLTVTANGGVSGLSYQWQSSSNNLTFTNIGGATSSSYTTPLLTSTMYYRVVVSASGNGCGSIISNAATVTVVPAPAIVTQPAATNVCMNGSGTFTVVASGGTPSLTYQWQKSSDNISFSNISGAVSSSLNTGALTASTYYRVMVGANGSGCATVTSASALASVSTLSTSAGSNMTICAGSPTTLSASATGGVSPYAFTWSNGLGIGETKTVSPTSQTTYSVTVTSAIGCTSSAQVVVSTNPIPNVNAGANKTICTGTTTTISATASGASSPYIFAWNNGLGAGASKSVTPSATTTYIVTVTSNNGCIGTGATTITVSNCVEICNNSLDDDGDGLIDCADSDCGPVADATNNLSICPGTPALLTTTVMGGNAPYTYTWNNGLGAGANKTVTPTITTTYGVTVTSASGCTSTDQVTVTIMPCSENCTNGIDDDFDGLIDCADPDCAGVTAPVLVADTYSTCPGMTFSERVTYNDANLNNPAFSIASNPQYGTVTIDATGKFTYVPTGFQCVTDYFIYQVCNQVSGCCQTATVTMNLSDATPPVLINVPADLTISCDDAFPSAGNVTAFDQCPGVYMDYTEASSQSYIGDCGSYVITKTWKATDFCGNQTTGVQLVNVVDQVKPELFRVYTLANGTRVAAGVVQKVTNEWKYVKLPITFSQKPLIFATVSSNGEFSAVNVQLRNIYTQGFEVRLREEEAADGKHGIETVSWIAIEPGSQNDAFIFQAGLFDNANDTLKTINFGSQFLTNPHFFASVQTTNETDPVSIRTTSLNASGVQFFLQEETSADAETKHANETMGYLAIQSTSRLLDKKGEAFGELGTINLSNAWATVTLTGKYTKPVVVMGALTNNDGQPVNVRVRNVGQNSFQVRLQEWDYQDGIHTTEGICWMVMEGGLPANTTQYCFGNANDLVPGVNIFAVDNCDDQVTFTYTEAPVSNDFGLMLTNRSWAAVDDCGNTVFLSRNDTCRVAAVKLKSSLNGAMVGSGNSNLMRDDLRVKSYVPAVQPYSAIPAFSGQTINYGETEFGNNVAMVITPGDNPPPPPPPPPPTTPYSNIAFDYKTVQNGLWNAASTWQGGLVPPTTLPAAKNVRIDHEVTVNNIEGITLDAFSALYVINGKLQVTSGSFTIQMGTAVFDNSQLVVFGNIASKDITSKLIVKNSTVYTSGYFDNLKGTRTLRGVCLTVDKWYTNSGGIDTLENVCATSGKTTKFQTNSLTFIKNSSFKVLSNDFDNQGTSLTGSGLTIWTPTSRIINGGAAGSWTATIDKYCAILVTGVPSASLPALASCATISTDFISCNCTVPATSGGGGSGSGSGTGTGVYSTLTPDFKTIANGLWSSPATWFNGLVPPVGDISSKVVKITHAVTLQNSNLNLKSNTALIVEGGSLTMSNGDFIIQDAKAYFINAAFTSPLGELTMDNTAAKLEMFNCQVSINEQFKNRKGKRRLQNVCLTLNDDFINDNGVDTLLNLCAIITKEFKNFNGGNSYLYDTKLKLNTGKLENGTGSTLSGDRNIIWVVANDLINNGTWKCVMDQYCVSGNVTVPQTYRPIIDACGLIQANFTPCNCSNSPTSYVENSTLTAPVPNPFVSVGKMDVALLETTGDKSVVDWVMVELRNANNDKQVIKVITALTCRDGEIVSEEGDPVLYFPGVPEGQYYVVLQHRNHLGLMTDVPFYLTTINTPTLDFMDLSLPVRGGNSAGRLSGGKRTLWGGDYNCDGKVVYQGPYNDVFNLFSRVVGDSQNSENLANYIVPGYELQDFNLDGKTIYQGPLNDRGAMLFNSILSHPLNIALLANYIALDAVP